MEEKELNQIEKILDEDNEDNIILYDDEGSPVEFEQVAVIPRDDETYVILYPITPMEGVGEDECVVFVIDEDEQSGEPILSNVIDDDVIDSVFEEFMSLVEEDGE